MKQILSLILLITLTVALLTGCGVPTVMTTPVQALAQELRGQLPAEDTEAVPTSADCDRKQDCPYTEENPACRKEVCGNCGSDLCGGQNCTGRTPVCGENPYRHHGQNHARNARHHGT